MIEARGVGICFADDRRLLHHDAGSESTTRISPRATPLVTTMQSMQKPIARAVTMTKHRDHDRIKVCAFFFVAMYFVVIGIAGAAEPGEIIDTSGRHPLYHKSLPPGGIWQGPAAGGSAAGFPQGAAGLSQGACPEIYQAAFQPVAFSGPQGTEFSLPLSTSYAQGEPNLMAGLLVGAVYRFRITGIPRAIGAELYPTVELIGRTYPPPGLETQFPIPINLSESDLSEALDGNLVTRVIYLEDPQTAIPMALERTNDRPVDIPLDQDALATADALGRPIAIVRIGSKSPPNNPILLPQFYFGYPAWAPIYQPEPMTPPQ
jgi:hypothetical protein